jgi:gas vesicle protein
MTWRKSALPGKDRFMEPAKDNAISISDAQRLRQAWAAKRTQYCRHLHFGIESTDAGYATGFYICKTCGTRKLYGSIPMATTVNRCRTSWLRVTTTFFGGAIIGAMLAAFVTPVDGSAVRQRLSRGAKNIRTEVPQLISDSREAYGTVAKDARQTFRQTVSRLTAIVKTCMGLVKNNVTASEKVREKEF